MAKVEDGKLSDFRPQENNANSHTERGLKALSDAYSEVGYVAPMTAAANGEVLDGSARLERAFDQFEDEALVVRHDGSRPIVMIREDVSDADDPMAKRISYGANRIGQIDLKWSPEQLLTDKKAGVDFSGIFTEEEQANIIGSLELDEEEKSDGSLLALVDVTIGEPRHTVEPGQVWRLGKHRLICCDVLTEWQKWVGFLDGDKVIFAPYPGPFVPLSLKAKEYVMVMVQPDPYIAGHIIDRYEEINGDKGIIRD